MRTRSVSSVRRVMAALAVLMVSMEAGAQSVSGQAAAVVASIAGVPATLAGTGWLTGPGDARGASDLGGPVGIIGTVESLWAATVSSVTGFSPPDEVSSLASAANLVISVAGQRIVADFLMAAVRAPVSGAPAPSSTVSGLTVNGVPLSPSGAQNQRFVTAGLSLVLNEVASTASGTTVSALHVTSTDGLVDVVVATATAGVTSGSGTLPIIPGLGL